MELRAVEIASNTLSIGRRPYNDLQLDDLTVSGEHAMVRVREGEVSIHDLDSRNGTLVNGQPVQQRELVDGDIIDIGVYRLRFEAARPGGIGAAIAAVRTSPAPRSARPRAETAGASGAGASGAGTASGAPVAGTRLAPEVAPHKGATGAPQSAEGALSASAGKGSAGGAASGGMPSANSDGELAPPAHLACLSGAAAGQVQALDRAINRVAGPVGQVAVVSRRKAGYFITHLEGLTFPQVNGEPIGLTAHRLADGDLIELAGIMLRFGLDA